MLRAQNESWAAQNQREICPQELWASDLEALEVSGTPRGDQESLKEVCKSPQIIIYGIRRVIMSREEPLAAPKEPPRSFLRAKMMFKVTQESSTDALKSRETILR